MFAAIIEGIVVAVEWVVTAWEALKEIRFIGRAIKGVACALQWVGYLGLISAAIEKLAGLGIPESKIADILGISGLIKKGQSIEKTIADSLSQARETVNSANDIDARLRMSPSALNGVHRPPYHSIAIHEVIYEFSNVLGSGNMIIIFNPEGFGMKPRAPEIIRYVDEAEFSEFINSESWGNYWRVNYLLRGRRRKRGRGQKVREKDVITGDLTVAPDSEPLDDYIERVLDLPEYADTVIAGEFQDMISEAFERQEKLTTKMVRAIETGGLGRGVEENGLRVTNALNENLRNIPANLKRIVATNPIFKDVAKVTAVYKRQLGRMRNIKNSFLSAGNLESLTSEAAALSSTLGAVGIIQTELGINLGVKIGADLGIEAGRAGATASSEALASVNSTIQGSFGTGELGTFIVGEDTLSFAGGDWDAVAKNLNENVGLNVTGEQLKAYNEALEAAGYSGEFWNEATGQWDFNFEGKIGQDLVDAMQGVGLDVEDLVGFWEGITAGKLASGFFTPPKCVPFII